MLVARPCISSVPAVIRHGASSAGRRPSSIILMPRKPSRISASQRSQAAARGNRQLPSRKPISGIMPCISPKQSPSARIQPVRIRGKRSPLVRETAAASIERPAASSNSSGKCIRNALSVWIPYRICGQTKNMRRIAVCWVLSLVPINIRLRAGAHSGGLKTKSACKWITG